MATMRPMSSGGGIAIGQGGPAAWGGKLQLQSPMLKRAPGSESRRATFECEEVVVPPLSSTCPVSALLTSGGGGTALLARPNTGPARNASKGSLRLAREISEVRALAMDEPLNEENPASGGGPHEMLVMRLKSRTMRTEADTRREFLASYRVSSMTSRVMDAQRDATMDSLIRSTGKRAEALLKSSEDLRVEVFDAERRLELATARVAKTLNADVDVSALNSFERGQLRIQQDKAEEESQRIKDEAEAAYVKVRRQREAELIELRDCRVFLRELRRIRLDRLQHSLVPDCDGRTLRTCMREMIRHGQQQVMQKLERSGPPLEPWMRSVLVNMCHLELRMEAKNAELSVLRKGAMESHNEGLSAMVSLTKQERYDDLRARTWESIRADGSRGFLPPLTEGDGGVDGSGDGGAGNDCGGSSGSRRASLAKQRSSLRKSFSTPSVHSLAAPQQEVDSERFPSDVLERIRSVEHDIKVLRKLLTDMRDNVAAVVCNRMRAAEKTRGSKAAADTIEWGRCVMSLLVSEDFAKSVMKEVYKSTPQGQMAD
eukprot:TRINITY_DN62319_c0_g1_i1.p1 TRINITY_DN62319_c0_g1~~TRINITY_DN62319_c0_g1_i1.p1  ORF type:complete len:571 (+),score=102.63 TRINITY_DN62319_c0_g1_i1:82-1713(+)